MNVPHLHQSRSLAHVLLEIGNADRSWRLCWSDEDADVETELLDKLEALQTEARNMVEQATGCAWNDLQRLLA